jgi:predicted lipid-binding transport protein (Tim44 family)
MKKALAVFTVLLALGLSSVTIEAQARRLGGGKSAGMQRQTTTLPAKPGGAAGTNVPGAPAQVAPAAGAAAATAAAAPKRSWMGPLAGLAAGLGLAALASHFGFGAALANLMTIGLLVLGVLLVIGFVMRKRAAMQAAGPAAAGAGAGAGVGAGPQGGWRIASGIGFGMPTQDASGAAVMQSGALPAGFDAAAFAAHAKTQFMALQAANDARDLARLRDVLTPEMFDLVRAEIAERGDAPQQTEVFGLEARVLAVAQEAGDYVASVHFTGSLREQPGAVPEDLDEIWHLTKPRSGPGGWVIAGIQQGAGASATA